MNPVIRRILGHTVRPSLLSAVVLGLGCTTMNTARPLEPGQHAVGLTLGGPVVAVAGPKEIQGDRGCGSWPG